MLKRRRVCWIILLLICLPYGRAFAEMQTISSQQLIDEATYVIKERAGSAVNNITVESLYQPQDTQVPLGPVVFDVELPNGIRYNSPTPVSVALHVDGKLVGRVALRFEVKLYQNIVVAARSIAIGEKLMLSNVRYDRRDIGRLSAGYISDMSRVVGLESRRLLTPGMALNESMLRKPVLIQHGSMVTIFVKIGGIEITTMGQALQDGCIDKIIRVQNLNSKRIISGKVIDDNSVLVVTK